MRRYGLARRVHLDFSDRLIVDAALDEAFAPLRTRTATIGAARVRAAARWTHPAATPLGGLALLARLGPLSVAAVISAFLFGAQIASLSSAPAAPGISEDAVSAGAWLLNGRTALQRPVVSRSTDYRMTAGDPADNTATVRREARRIARAPEQASSNNR